MTYLLLTYLLALSKSAAPSRPSCRAVPIAFMTFEDPSAIAPIVDPRALPTFVIKSESGSMLATACMSEMDSLVRDINCNTEYLSSLGSVCLKSLLSYPKISLSCVNFLAFSILLIFVLTILPSAETKYALLC